MYNNWYFLSVALFGSIQHYVIKFVSDVRQVVAFFLFPPPRYNWNIVESGVKHHKPYSTLFGEHHPLSSNLQLFFCYDSV
jgi:hypothetical protein